MTEAPWNWINRSEDALTGRWRLSPRNFDDHCVVAMVEVTRTWINIFTREVSMRETLWKTASADDAGELGIMGTGRRDAPPSAATQLRESSAGSVAG